MITRSELLNNNQRPQCLFPNCHHFFFFFVSAVGRSEQAKRIQEQIRIHWAARETYFQHSRHLCFLLDLLYIDDDIVEDETQ